MIQAMRSRHRALSRNLLALWCVLLIACSFAHIQIASAHAHEVAEVADIARRVDEQGRSMGMALTSCTVPAAGRPTFELGEHEIEVGIVGDRSGCLEVSFGHQPRRNLEGARALLAATLNREQLAAITTGIGLSDAIAAATDILEGRVRGRLIVDVNH